MGLTDWLTDMVTFSIPGYFDCVRTLGQAPNFYVLT